MMAQPAAQGIRLARAEDVRPDVRPGPYSRRRAWYDGGREQREEAARVEADRRLEAEQRYIGGGMSLRALAEETGIPAKTLMRWSREGDWVKKREKVQARAAKKAATMVVNRRARQLSRLMRASDGLEQALEMAAKQLTSAMQAAQDTPERIADGRFRAGNVRQLTDAVARAVETRMLLEGMVTAPQAARMRADEERLAIERERLAMDKTRADAQSGAGGVEVVMTGDAEALAE